jgi:hypothetical protein
LRIAYCVLRIGALRPQDASTHVRPQDRSYCAARNRYNLAPYFPCGAQRYTHSSAGLQAGLVQGPRRGPLYPPSLESICRGLETHVRPQDVQYAIRNTQYATPPKMSFVKKKKKKTAIRNTQYAIRYPPQSGLPIRNTQYAIRYTPQSGLPIRNTQYAIRNTLPTSKCQYAIRNTQYASHLKVFCQYAIRNTQYATHLN